MIPQFFFFIDERRIDYDVLLKNKTRKCAELGSVVVGIGNQAKSRGQ